MDFLCDNWYDNFKDLQEEFQDKLNDKSFRYEHKRPLTPLEDKTITKGSYVLTDKDIANELFKEMFPSWADYDPILE
jgi:hypothetical protein